MIVSIHQPNYLPYLGFFDKMVKSDIMILYDDAEFVREMFYNRNKIKTSNGTLWMTVPVKYKMHEHPKINEILIDNHQRWQYKQWMSIHQFYHKAPYFNEVYKLIQDIFLDNNKFNILSDVSILLIARIVDILGIKTKLYRSSTIPIAGDRSEKLLKICLAYNADTYLSGATGNKYLDESMFNKCNIKVEYQHYIHPVYNQLYGDFIPNMCILDLLFNHGIKESLSILTNK